MSAESDQIRTLKDLHFKLTLAREILLKGETVTAWELIGESIDTVKDSIQAIEEKKAGLM